MRWKLFEDTEKEPEVVSFCGLFAVLFIIALVVANSIGLADWLEKKAPFVTIAFQGVLVPLTIALTASFILYIGECCRIHVFQMRQLRRNENNYRVTAYSRRQMTLIAWHSLAPVEHIALKMLKLEGSMPLAPETPLEIDSEGGYDAPRLEIILRKLVEPLKEKLNEPYVFDVSVWARGQEADYDDSVRNALKAAGIKTANVTAVHVLEKCPGYSFIEKWINTLHQRNHSFHLLLIADLHGEDKKAFMESASAFLFGYYSDRAEKPLFISMPLTQSEDLETAAAAFIRTKCITSAKVFWHTGLERKEKYPLYEVLNQEKTAPERRDLDTTFGQCSDGYRWLALTLAADAALYAQGPQLVAASGSNEFGLLSLADSYYTPPDPPQAWLPLPIFHTFLSTIMMLVTIMVADIAYSTAKEPIISFTTCMVITCLTGLITGSIAWLAIVMGRDESHDSTL